MITLTSLAVRKLCKELKKDKSPGSYYYAWQSNIAMAFYDECKRQKVRVSRTKLAMISNQAAKNFLDLLIK